MNGQNLIAFEWIKMNGFTNGCSELSLNIWRMDCITCLSRDCHNTQKHGLLTQRLSASCI